MTEKNNSAEAEEFDVTEKNNPAEAEERAVTDHETADGFVPDETSPAKPLSASADASPEDTPAEEEAESFAAEPPTEEAGEETDAPKRKFSIGKFWSEWGAVVILLLVPVLVAVMIWLAVTYGGEIYDKVAVLWLFVFAFDTVMYFRKKSVKTLVTMIVTGVASLACFALYILELLSVLP